MIYIADKRSIRTMTDAGSVATLAGDPTQYQTVDGTGTSARFGNVRGICVAPNGDLFVTDLGANVASGGIIRKVTQAGVVTTIAGDPSQYGSQDGTGVNAKFKSPWGITIAPDGNLFVCDFDASVILRVTQAGEVTLFAGQRNVQGAQNGTGTNALFYCPFGIVSDSSGNLFVSEIALYAPAGVGRTIRKITPQGVVTTFAGSFGQVGTEDGTGANARFVNPSALAIDQSNNLFVFDGTNLDSTKRIRKITPSGVVTTIGGTQGEIYESLGLAISPTGKLYIADSGRYVIREQQT